MSSRLRNLFTVFTLFLALSAVAISFLRSGYFQAWGAERFKSSIESAFPVKAHFHSFDFDPFSLTLTVGDLRLFTKGDHRNGQPLLEVGRLVVDLRLMSLVTSSREFDRVLAERFVIRVPEERGQLTAAQAFRLLTRLAATGPKVEIGALRLEEGTLIDHGRRVGFSTPQFGFSGRIGAEGDSLSGTLSVRDLEWTYGDLRVPPTRIEVDFRADAEGIESVTLRLSSKAVSGRLEGWSRFDSGAYRFEVRADADLSHIPSGLLPDGLESGSLLTSGILEGQGPAFRYQGRLDASALSISGQSIESMQGSLDASRERILITGLTGRVQGGELNASLELGLNAETPSKARASVRGAALQSELWKGTGNARLELAWPGLDWLRSTGEGQLDFKGLLFTTSWGRAGRLLSPASDDRLPLHGAARIEVSPGRIALTDGRIEGPGLDSSLTASLAPDGEYSADLEVRLDPGADRWDRAAAALLPDVDRWREAVRIVSPALLSIQAQGARFSGRLQELDLLLPGQRRGRISGRFLYADGVWSFDDALLQGDDFKALWSGRIQASSDSERGRFRIELDDLPLDLLGDFLGSEAALAGRVDGRMQGVVSTAAGLGLSGALQARNLSAFGESVESITTRVQSAGGVHRLTEISGRFGSGRLTGDLEIDPGRGRLKGRLAARDLPVENVRILQERLALRGSVDLDLRVEGELDRPRINLSLEAQSLEHELISLENLRIRAHSDQGTLRFEMGHDLLGNRLRSSGQLELVHPYRLKAQVQLSEVPMKPYLSLLSVPVPEGLQGTLGGQLSVEGPLADPEKISAGCELDTFVLSLAGYQLRSSGPFSARMVGGTLSFQPLLLQGANTELLLSGEVTLVEPRSLQVKLEGSADLGLLEGLLPTESISGQVRAQAVIAGSWEDPRVVGSAQLEKGFLFSPLLPTALEEASGAFKFTPSQVAIDSFSASTRYGTVTASGGIFLDGFRPASWKVGIRGERLNFEFPRDVQSEVDVDLEYLKGDSAELVHGSVVVRSAEYSRNLTVTDLIAEYLRLPDRAGVARAGEDSIDLNIQVRANNTLRVSNNLADLRGSADVTLRGTLASPVILGDLIIDEGRLFLEHNEYEFSRGSINFNNPRRTSAHFNLEAATSVREFEVTAQIRGPLDRLKVNLRSDPPLPTGDIVSLLAVGRTQRELFGGGAGESPTSLALLGAGTLLSRGLGERLEAQTDRLFGLNQFSVDPFLAGSGRSPGARLTVGRNFKNVRFSYTTDLGVEDPGQVVAVEIRLNRRVTAVATREQDGSLAVDLKLRKRF